MDLTLELDDQDRVMHLCLLDSKFLKTVIRKKIEPRHFTSEVRQKVFKAIAEFFKAYDKAPGEDIVYEIETRIKQRKIKEEDAPLYEEYIMNIASIPPFSKERIEDHLDEFIKERISTNLLNSLLKMQDFISVEPSRAIDLIKEAADEASLSIGRKTAESILEDDGSEFKVDFVTKFGISMIDEQLNGGLRKGNYVVIQAYTGIGKSWCINHLSKMAVRFGNTPLVVHTEMPNKTARVRYKMSFTGLTNKEIRDKPEEVKNQVKRSINKKADLFLLSEEEKSMRVDEIPSVIEEIEIRTGKKVSAVMLDSADDMMPPEGRYKNKLEENTAIHTYLKNLAKNEDILIISTAQVRREGESKFWCGSSNVGDNINKFRKATVGISLNAIKKEKDRHLFRVWLFKNTDGAEGARVWIMRDYARGQFVTKYGKYERNAYEVLLEKTRPFEDSAG
jgi:replicative DNA helicase